MTQTFTPTPSSIEGLPPADTKQQWIGESADGRQWVIRYSNNPISWVAIGFLVAPPFLPELRILREDNANFIVRSHLSPVQP
jgi:hypothetical protein